MGVYGSPDLSTDLSSVKEKPKKPKKPLYKRWWFIALVIILAIGVFGDNDNGSYESNKEVISKDEFIASAQEYNYKDIERNPDQYKGKPAVFRGKVIQVAEGSFNTVVYRVATKGDFDDVVYVTYKRQEGEPRVLENDIVEIYGDLEGVTTYTSVLGGNITIPSVKARYIIINE